MNNKYIPNLKIKKNSNCSNQFDPKPFKKKPTK